MKEFIEQIEKIENLGVDTRAECLMFLAEVKKLKKMVQDQITEDGGLPIVSNNEVALIESLRDFIRSKHLSSEWETFLKDYERNL
jgi:hypothetical protein